MKRLEPNTLLAACTVLALLLVVLSASLNAPQNALKYVALALACPVGFILLNAWMLKRRNRVPRVMITPEFPGMVIWASIFPLMVMTSAVLPFLAPSADFGLMIIIAGVWTGVTIESALQARRNADQG